MMARPFDRRLLLVLVAAAACFLVGNVTSTSIYRLVQPTWRVEFSDAENYLRVLKYFLTPAKSVVFFVASAVLLASVVRLFIENREQIFGRVSVAVSSCAILINVLLTATVFPASYGRGYARVSIDPFSQDVDHLYRRILLPALAHTYHLDGFLYTLLFWASVFLCVLLVKWYLRMHEVRLSWWEEASLLSVGIFASGFQLPGYPDATVLLLALVALIAFERDGGFSYKQVAAFALALSAHEAAAVIVFAPLALFVFKRPAVVPFAVLLGLYGAALLANFGFDPVKPFRVQTTVSDKAASDYFMQSPAMVLLAALFAFKALWAVVPMALAARTDGCTKLTIVAGLALPFAATTIAVDYSRMIGFAVIPLLLSLTVAVKSYSRPVISLLFLIGILIPSFYVGGNSGLVTFRGGYYAVYSQLFDLPLPVTE